MPYDNAYNRGVAKVYDNWNDRFSTLFAYSPVDGRGGFVEGGSNAGVLFQMGNASKRDSEDNVVNNDLSLPQVYYYGNDSEMKGGNGFAQGTFRDRGDGHSEGVSAVYKKGEGMSGGAQEVGGRRHARVFGHIVGKMLKGKGKDAFKGVLDSPWAGLMENVPESVYKGLGQEVSGMGMSGGAILGNPDPYPVKGDSQRIAGRGREELQGGGWWDDFKSGFNSVFEPVASIIKPVAGLLGQPEITAGLSALGYGKKTRGRPKGSGKKQLIGQKQDDLLAMPASSVVLANGVPPEAQLRGSYGGGSKPHSKAEMKVMKAVEKKLKGKGMSGDRAIGSGASGAICGDGRKARAEIVKKIMKEKGLKMIEASKYVKEHNLYKK